MSTYEDASEPTPQAYGLPEDPNPQQIQVWNRQGLSQGLFLAAYGKTGKRGVAAKETGVLVFCVLRSG
jgi:hypothetical protein